MKKQTRLNGCRHESGEIFKGVPCPFENCMVGKLEVGHTPTPWKIDPEGKTTSGHRYIVAHDDSMTVCAASPADAEFIVRAVNQYQSLVNDSKLKDALLETLEKANAEIARLRGLVTP